MKKDINTLFEKLNLKDDKERYNALQELLTITEEKVNWFSEYKNEIIAKLTNENSYQRSIGLMLLCNLVKSDENNEFQKILNLMLPLINDEKFITQRQYIQNIWKAAVVNPKYEKIVVNQLEKEFKECTNKKHYNLLRIDIISSLVNIKQKNNKSELIKIINELIDFETDVKSKKKYIKLLDNM